MVIHMSTKAKTKAITEPALSKNPAPMITQEELAQFKDVNESANKLGGQQKKLGESLKDRITKGVPIEPGPLTAVIIPSERAGFTVGPCTVRSLKVFDTTLASSPA
jgi:hypothetical protein